MAFGFLGSLVNIPVLNKVSRALGKALWVWTFGDAVLEG